MSNNVHFDFHANNDKVPNNVNTVTIYSSVTTIRNSAFRYRRKLQSVVIPNSITAIGYSAFYRCDQLQSLILPNSITTIGAYAFNNCYMLQSLILPNSITTIGASAFCDCIQLQSLILPNSITTIGHYAFSNCRQLQSLILPNSITTIGARAFDRCTALEQRLPNGLNNNANTETWLQQRFNNLPIHQSVYNTATLTTTILTDLIIQHRSTLTTTDAMGMTPLHVLCSNPNVESLEMAQILTDAEPDVAFMQTVTGHTPLMMLLHRKGFQRNEYYYAYYHEEDGELVLLPLVRLLERGLNYVAVEATLILHKRQLMPEIDVKDEVSGLLPFMYAALLMECSLGVVYQLAIQRPDLLQKNIIEDNSVSHVAKRQKLDKDK